MSRDQSIDILPWSSLPGVDSFDWQARIFNAYKTGDVAQAQQMYATILPGIVFMMQSLDHLVCYGKRIAAVRLGIDKVHERAPVLVASAFGEQCAARFANLLGPLV